MFRKQSRVTRKRKKSCKKKRRLVDFLEEVSEALEDASLPNYKGESRSPTNLEG